MSGRLIKGVHPGTAIGADELGRYLSPGQRETLVARLTGDVEARAAALVADARATAAAIVGDAESQADTVRRQAYDEGYAAGQTAALQELEGLVAMVRAAAAAADGIREALLEGVEEQAVALALEAARRVVGAAADSHAGLAATVVREGVRAAGGRVLRVRVNPADLDTVAAELHAAGRDLPVHEDAAIEVGGCIIDVEGGTVDLRLDAQIEGIADALLGEA
jgi:flagellar assembly protein FliH